MRGAALNFWGPCGVITAENTTTMEPQLEHTFYTWLIIIAIVCVATIVGALISRYRMMRRYRLPLELKRRRECAKAALHH